MVGHPRIRTVGPENLTPIKPLGKLSVGNVFRWGQAVLSKDWGVLAGCSLFIFFYNIISGIIIGALDGVLVGVDAWIEPLNILHSILVITPMGAGPVYLAAKAFRGQETEFQDMFIGFRRWVPVMGIALIIQCVVHIVTLPLGAVMLFVFSSTGYSWISTVAIIAMILALVLVSTYLTIRIYFATLLCADPLGPNLGTVDSIKESWRITSNHMMVLFSATILVGTTVLVTFLLLFIPGLLYGMPLSYAAAGGVYVFLTHRYGIIPVTGYEDCPYCGYSLKGLDTCTCPECGSYVQREVEGPIDPIQRKRTSDLMSMPLPAIPLADPDDDAQLE